MEINPRKSWLCFKQSKSQTEQVKTRNKIKLMTNLGKEYFNTRH